MAYDEGLAQRLRERLADDPAVSAKNPELDGWLAEARAFVATLPPK